MRILNRIVLTISAVCLALATALTVCFFAVQFHRTAPCRAPSSGGRPPAAAGDSGPSPVALHNGPMAISCLRPSVEDGLNIYDGSVRIELAGLTIDCPRVERPAAGLGSEELTGSGGAVIRGFPGFQRIRADNFVLDTRRTACSSWPARCD